MEKDNIRQQDPFSAYGKKKIVLKDGRVYTGNILRLAHGKVELVVSLDKEDILEISPLNKESGGEVKASRESGKEQLARAIADMFGEEDQEAGEDKEHEEEIRWYLHPLTKPEPKPERDRGREQGKQPEITVPAAEAEKEEKPAGGIPRSDDPYVMLDEKHFPDQNFLACLREAFDPGDEGKILRSSVTKITVRKKGILDLTGIGWFGDLVTLDCAFNGISELDLSGNSRLERLNCANNELSRLEISRNGKLKRLHCNANRLTGLDLPRNGSLEMVNCVKNQISSLDLSGTGLKESGVNADSNVSLITSM